MGRNSNKTTLKDIADATGYSIPTVSRVLNDGDKFYSDETARIILEAAKNLNYTPNMMAKGLKTGKTYSIALLQPQMDEYYNNLFQGIHDKLSTKGYSVATLSSDYKPELENVLIEHIRKKSYDGVIVATGFLNEEYNKFPNRIFDDIPMVMIEREYHNDGIPTVKINVKEACYKEAEYLIKQGHDRIAFLSAPARFETIKECFLGYKDALRDYGIPYRESLVVFDEALEKTDYKVCYQFMQEQLKDKKFTAIISLSDFAAFAALRVAKEMNLRVPEDLSIFGFDDLLYTEYTIPSLATVSQNTYTAGVKGAELLLEHIDGNNKRKTVEIDCELLIRESVGRCNKNE